MICSPCRKAGLVNTETNRLIDSGLLGRNNATLAQSMHKGCRGGTWCDCQHVVGRALNMTLINQTAEEAVAEEPSADVLEPVELCT